MAIVPLGHHQNITPAVNYYFFFLGFFFFTPPAAEAVGSTDAACGGTGLVPRTFSAGGDRSEAAAKAEGGL